MSKEDTQKLKELVETISSNVKSIKEQQSVINEKIDVQGENIDDLGSKVGVLSKKADENGRKLGILWEQVEKVTVNLENVQETQGLHTASLKIIEGKVDNNSDDTSKVNKRLIKAEDRLGIVPPPEFTLN